MCHCVCESDDGGEMEGIRCRLLCFGGGVGWLLCPVLAPRGGETQHHTGENMCHCVWEGEM